MAVVYEGPMPEDLMIEVLSLLPVKTLLQFKCVCKSWYGLITSPHFISKHLNNNKDGRLLVHYFIAHGVPNLLELFQDETLADLSHQRLELPMDAEICGPCNGLFYLDYGYSLRDSGLWNPATKEFKLLPKKITKPNLPPDVNISETFGFGLDPVTNDYKVVTIQHLWLDGRYVYPSPVSVYTLRTDCWKYWGELPKEYGQTYSSCYTYVNGVFYWWVLEEWELILCFDMALDIFHEIQLPEYEKPPVGTLAIYDDSIAFFSFYQIHVRGFLDIWVMKERCWIKQFTVAPLLSIRTVAGYWKSGQVFLESETHGLILCNPISQEIKDLEFEGPCDCSQIGIYKESLVSIKDRIGCSQDEEYYSFATWH